MCGVFGFVSRGRRVNLQRLEKIAAVTETRGKHAFGLAWVTAEGRLRMFKQTGRISEHMGVLRMAADARLIIGHCRYATQGAVNNLNNHPHPADGGWFVHNGMIGDYDQVVREHVLAPVSECDSEVLGLLVEQAGEGKSMVERCMEAVRQTRHAPLVMLGIWRKPEQLVAVKRGNPLHLGDAGGDGLYLGSLAEALPGKVTNLQDCSGYVFEAGTGGGMRKKSELGVSKERRHGSEESRRTWCTAAEREEEEEGDGCAALERCGEFVKRPWEAKVLPGRAVRPSDRATH